MKNLNYPNTNEIQEFDSIANSKHINTRNRLHNIRNRVVSDYESYLNDFATISQIGPSTFNPDESSDLRNCYQIQTAARDKLLSKIVDWQTDQFKDTCPYCLLLNRTTYDHYIPEGKYPVYSVLAKNLLPCCHTCNSKKNEYWRENRVRAILHFYNDLIPQTQFLFGTLAFNQNNIPVVSFNLQQTQGISNDLFTIIQKHFERLDLNKRYTMSINLVVSDIKVDVTTNRSVFGNSVTAQSITDCILIKSNCLKQHYGINYWKSIAMDLLANSQQFINSL